MKKLYILFLSLLPFCGFGLESLRDTIEVQIGEGKKVIFYAENLQGLRDLQKYDFNKILKKMNQELKATKTSKTFIKDFDGDTFEKSKEPFFKTLDLNYYVGFNYSNSLPPIGQGFIAANELYGFPDGRYAVTDTRISSTRTSNSVFRSPHFGFSVGRNPQILRTNRFTFRTRLAAEVNASFQQVAYKPGFSANSLVYDQLGESFPFVEASGTPSKIGVVDTLSTFNYNTETKGITWQAKSANGDYVNYDLPPYSVFNSGLNLRFVPNVSFMSKSGKRLLNVGLGGFFGLNMITRVRNKTVNSINPVIQSNLNYAPLNYGLIGELGIGQVNLFAQVSYLRRRDVSTEIVAANISGSRLSELGISDSAPLYTFGLRFGK
ncbi:MAG: hypothetical protein ACI9IP_002181 [Arcticibacterium sp.]|jgi:hypothetical protein